MGVLSVVLFAAEELIGKIKCGPALNVRTVRGISPRLDAAMTENGCAFDSYFS